MKLASAPDPFSLEDRFNPCSRVGPFLYLRRNQPNSSVLAATRCVSLVKSCSISSFFPLHQRIFFFRLFSPLDSDPLGTPLSYSRLPPPPLRPFPHFSLSHIGETLFFYSKGASFSCVKKSPWSFPFSLTFFQQVEKETFSSADLPRRLKVGLILHPCIPFSP